MKTILIATLSLLPVMAAYSQIKPDPLTLDGHLSAAAAKFCDMYSQYPKLEAGFIIGSSFQEYYAKAGIEEIKFICLDGFEKTFWMVPEKKRQVMSIDYLSPTKGVIHYADGSASTSELFFCPARPISYLVIKKK